MNIVDKVAEDIAQIPGDPTPEEIARVAIEAYQREVWTPAFDNTAHGWLPELRRLRVDRLTSYIIHTISKYLREDAEVQGHKYASRDLYDALYEAGAEVITDHDRREAGLLPRDQYGLTAEDLRILEARRTMAMLAPLPPQIVPAH